MKISKSFWIIFVITLVGFILRFYRLSDTPPSLNWDEVSHGYNAYSIIKTGKDEWGFSMPHIFRAFGDFKLPIYIYLTTIPVAIMGLTPVAIRLISVIAGTLAIPFIYLLTKQLFPQSKKFDIFNLSFGIPEIAALFLAITPWHFFISRPALEANLSLTFIIAGFYFLLKSIKSNNYLIVASIILSLSVHTYNTARIFTPLLCGIFFLIYRPKYRWNMIYFASVLTFVAALGLVVYQTITGTGLARYDKLTILSPQAVYQIGQDRLNSTLPIQISKLVHNRPIYFISEVTKNYLGYFSPQFFWQSSGTQTQFAIPNQNLFGLPVFILFICGLVHSFKAPKNFVFLYVWLLLSPLAASLTASPPQALRPNPLIPVAIIFASYCLSLLPKIAKLSIIIVCLIYFSIYLNQYFTVYKAEYSQSWQYGYQQAINYISTHQDEYKKIFFTKRYGEPHIFYAFFTHLEPKIIQDKDSSLRFFQSNWYWTDRIKNVYFINDWLIPANNPSHGLRLESGETIDTKNSLLITSPDHLPSNIDIIDTINLLNNQPIFVIAKFK